MPVFLEPIIVSIITCMNTFIYSKNSIPVKVQSVFCCAFVASFFLSHSASTSTSSPTSSGSRSLLFFSTSRFFAYFSDLPCASLILQNLLKSYVSLNTCPFLGSRLFFSICSGEKLYFADWVLFKLKVAF